MNKYLTATEIRERLSKQKFPEFDFNPYIDHMLKTIKRIINENNTKSSS